MRAGVRLAPRERRLAFVAAGFIGCWVVVSWILQPLWERAGESRLRVRTQTEKLQAIGRLLAQGPAIEREYEGLAGLLEPADDEGAHAAFLSELEELSRRSNLQLSLKPRPLKQDERTSRFEVELDVQGSQQHIMAFLDQLLRMPRLIAIDRLRISGVPAKEDLLRVNVVIQKLSFR
jgi:Tfp pilus assembly protein PilO